jgi:hypothetical protein
MRALAIIGLLVAVAATPSTAQEAVPPDTVLVEPEIGLEQVLEEVTLDAEDSQLIDLLTYLSENPLNLNSATVDELLQIPGLTPMTAQNIVAAREERRFTSTRDLLEVEGVEESLYAMMLPFITLSEVQVVSDPPILRSFTSRHRTVRDLQQRRGFLDGSFRGSAEKVYNRFVVRSRDFTPPAAGERPTPRTETSLTVGVLTEKDAGERSLTDFVAGYADVRLAGLSTRVIVGDYTVEAAEGLVFWRSIGFSKGSEVISSVRKGGRGIRPYLSTDENWYFRGVAVETDLGVARVSALYSDKPIHATVSGDGIVTSFYTSGLFRTSSESTRRAASHHRLVGARVGTNPISGVTLNASGYSTTFSHHVSRAGVFGFKGSTARVFGVDATYSYRNVSLFSEVARSHTEAIAGVAGLLYRPMTGLDIALAARSYPMDFVSIYGFGFGESSGSTQNESGLYAAVRMRVAPWMLVSAYFDQFAFPWRTSVSRMPTSGNDFLVLSDFRLARRTTLQVQYKSRNKPATETLSDPFGRAIRIDGERWQKNYRATFQYQSSIAFRWRSRLELVNVGYGSTRVVEKGMLAFQDIRLHPLPRLVVDARIIAFETDSFDSRVYEFENDLRGTFSNPALFGRGIRWYVLARYEVFKAVDISAKYAQTVKEGVRVLSSGSSLIEGDLDNRLSVQLDVVF